jgi:hypothetical protein
MYLNIQTLEYPLSFRQIVMHLVDTSFSGDDGVDLSHLGYAHVAATSMPSFDPITQSCTETSPVKVNGVWTQQWQIAALDAATISANQAAYKLRRIADLAAIRYTHETAGISLAGSTIRTDRESQALVTGAWCRAQQHPDVLIDWKGESGWTQINAATVNALADAVGAHVQACFSRERALYGQITAATTVAEIAAIDLEAGWPA